MIKNHFHYLQEEQTVYPNVEIQNILLNHTAEEIGDYAETTLQKLRTSVYDIMTDLAGESNDISIHLYVLRHAYKIGSGNINIVINITKTEMNVTLARPINSGQSMFSSIIETIKKWWKSVIKFFS